MKLRDLCVWVVAAGWMSLPCAWSVELGSGTCQILDKPLAHAYEVSISYIAESRFEGYGKSAALELGADWPFGYIKDFGGGEMDFCLVVQDILFLDSAGLELPDQVGKIVLDSGFTLRSPSGTAVQIRLLPGLYTDLDKIQASSFTIPVSWRLIRAFNPELSGMVGLDARPGFERMLMPVIGLAWKISDDLRLDAGLPNSRFQWAVTPAVTTAIGFEWQNTSYALSESNDGHGEQITLEDVRAYWGLLYKVSDILQFSGEIGNVFKRSVEFDVDSSSEIDIENALYVRLGIGAPF